MPKFSDIKSPVDEVEEWSRMVCADSTIKVDECQRLRRLIGIWGALLRKAANKLAAERSACFRGFVRKAISHKGAQGFHRMLKKQTVEMARPTLLDPVTTADQSHADEQIHIWKETWSAADYPQQDTGVPDEMLQHPSSTQE